MQLTEQLARAFAAMGRAINERDAELPRSDYLTLVRLANAVEGEGPCRPSDLAHAEGLDPSTMSRRVASLTERGLVERETDPDDRRAHRLRLTVVGAEALRVERHRRVALVTDALAGWEESDKDQLARLLGKLSDTLESRRTPAP
ncbi:MarR family winged helix-turn-helix transcriptional regulator [Ornithinimicrobium avium]|uniref:MarR family transcriptional regulator n=1 Tax=Ornithinimicrobium avium TaxID=2283195 RepID=A0A345NNF4_9MICO|nr:MarR family winged helix-turn-helix transcriptional regulator [Ornithinimicrobium avium]AXH96562.1 MarR family transcriptional regulator [Ornithinimicrobium avium]